MKTTKYDPSKLGKNIKKQKAIKILENLLKNADFGSYEQEEIEMAINLLTE